MRTPARAAAASIVATLVVALALLVTGLALTGKPALILDSRQLLAGSWTTTGAGALALHLGVIALLSIPIIRTIACAVSFGREGDRGTVTAAILVILMVIVSLAVGLLA